MSRPLIAVSGRRIDAHVVFPHEAPVVEGHSLDVHFAAHGAQIAAAGGIPVQLPFEAEPFAVVDRIDGVVLSGGVDIEPWRYGGPPDWATSPSPARDEYEFELLEAALRRGIPILGVCRGLQLLNVACGGTLIPSLEAAGFRDHYSAARSFNGHVHEVVTEPGTLAEAIYGPRTQVNSSHRQAPDRVGDGLAASGRSADDGVIEIVELPGRPVLGVQWHPEALPAPDPAYRWLVTACARDLTAT